MKLAVCSYQSAIRLRNDAKSAHLTSKAQLSYASVLMVIPNHHLDVELRMSRVALYSSTSNCNLSARCVESKICELNYLAWSKFGIVATTY